MNTKNTKLLAEAPVPKALRKLATPAIIAMMVGAVYNLVDTFFIGMLNDTAALGAATILFPVFMLISAIGLTFGMGAASVISRKLGEKEYDEASTVASTAFFSSLAVGIIASLAGLVFISPLLRLFGATESILKESMIYGSIIIGGSVFQMINMTMNNMIRAEGAAKTSGIAISMGALLNIILDPIFMFGLDMGLAGAAAATITGQGISTLFLLSFYLRKKSVLKLSPRGFHPSKRIYKAIMTIGTATFVRQVLASLAMGVLNNAAAPFGDSAIAAIGITMRTLSLPMMVLFGFLQGFMPLAGYSYGAQNYSRLKESINFALRWTTAFSLIASIVFIGGSHTIVGLFTSDSMVLQQGTTALRMFSLPMPLMGLLMTYAFLYQALGRGRPSLFLAAARQGFFFVPFALILPKLFGIYGLFAIQPAADLLTVVITLFLALKINRELKGSRDKVLTYEKQEQI